MSKVNKWTIDKQFDFCFGHRVWSQALDTQYSLDGCLACRHLHGHQGKVKLFLGANELEKGMVTDFKHTNIFKKWLDDVMDHKFIIDMNDPLFDDMFSLIKLDFNKNWIDFESENSNLLIDIVKDYKYAVPDLDHLDGIITNLQKTNEEKLAIYEKFEGLIIVDFVPTSENLCKWWYNVANKMLNGLGIDVVAVEYWETPKSHCRYQPK